MSDIDSARCEVHDLDVLAELVKRTASAEPVDWLNLWEETIGRERAQRVDSYRQLTLGRTSIWNDWRHGLPQGNRLALAAMARIRVTARATDTHPRRTAQISRIAIAVFDALRRAHAAPAFGEHTMRRVLRAAARLQRVGDAVHAASHRKAAQRFLRALPLPPSWTFEEWELLAQTLRYHRGTEPSSDRGAFGRLHEDEQKNIRALAGVLRLARGEYTAEVYLFEGGNMISAQVTPFYIDQTGLERQLFNFAREWPLIYGTSAVAMALMLGWLSSLFFRQSL